MNMTCRIKKILTAVLNTKFIPLLLSLTSFTALARNSDHVIVYNDAGEVIFRPDKSSIFREKSQDFRKHAVYLQKLSCIKNKPLEATWSDDLVEKYMFWRSQKLKELSRSIPGQKKEMTSFDRWQFKANGILQDKDLVTRKSKNFSRKNRHTADHMFPYIEILLKCCQSEACKDRYFEQVSSIKAK